MDENNGGRGKAHGHVATLEEINDRILDVLINDLPTMLEEHRREAIRA